MRSSLLIRLILVSGLFLGCSPKSNQPSSNSNMIASTPALQFVLPSSPQRIPDGIMEHIVFVGIGGAEGEMLCPCIAASSENVTLSGFPPNSIITLVVYSTSSEHQDEGTYFAHTSIRIDSQGGGGLKVYGLSPNQELVALDSNGNILSPRWAEDASFYIGEACIGSPRFSAGDVAMVSLTPKANRVRTGPSTEYRYIGEIGPGSKVIILEGPECSDGFPWWRVREISSGLEGWTREGDSSDHWLVSP